MIDSFEAVALRPSIIRQQWLPLKVAMQEIVEFGKRFGLEHILLACHAALLSNLTPELINLVRINFLNYRGIDCSWIAEADFLLSPLCRSVDDTLFEVEPMVRELLLTELERRYGWQRLQEVAAFLLQYLKTSQNPKERPGVAQVQEWIAYSYLQPDKVVRELTELLEQSIAPGKDAHVSQYEKLQLATTMETVAGPLKNTALQQDYQHLIHSTRAFARFLYGSKDLPPLASISEQPAFIDGASLTTLFPSGVQQWIRSIAPTSTTSTNIPSTEPTPPIDIRESPTIDTEVERLLTLAGWTIQDYAHADIRSAHGVAIRNFPIRTGTTESIDYLLFVDQQAAGVIFIMEEGQNRIGLEEATSLSSHTPMLRGEKPRRDPIPFTYETNAQGTLIRFTSYLDPVTRTRSVFAFHRPETFALWLQQAPPNVAKSRTDLLRARLRRMPSLSREGLWNAQYEAITNLEKSLAENRPRALIQMSSGSGKTYAMISSIYRLLKFGSAHRVLYLTDHNERARYVSTAFQNYLVPDESLILSEATFSGEKPFPELYNVQFMHGTLTPDVRVLISPIQSLARQLFSESTLRQCYTELHSLSENWLMFGPTSTKEVMELLTKIGNMLIDVFDGDQLEASAYLEQLDGSTYLEKEQQEQIRDLLPGNLDVRKLTPKVLADYVDLIGDLLSHGISVTTKTIQYNPNLPIDAFDLVVIDECSHSIIEQQRSVLMYFDAFLIGLTEAEDTRIPGFFNNNVVYKQPADALIELPSAIEEQNKVKQEMIRKIWRSLDIVRGSISYENYIEQLTYLLFLKMIDEQTLFTFSGVPRIPSGYDWQSLKHLEGVQLQIHYNETLQALGHEKGILGIIFHGAQNKIKDPVALRGLLTDLDSENWTELGVNVLGEIYEGLLQKFAEDGYKTMGQYFTSRPLIQAIIDVMRPEPGQRICDPACGTGGFLLAAYEYAYINQRDPNQLLALTRKPSTFHGWELVDTTARICAMNLFLHGISNDKNNQSPITVADSLFLPPGEHYDMVLCDPPLSVNMPRLPDREAFDHFWIKTKSIEMNFLQLTRSLLNLDGQAAIVVPDGVLFRPGANELIRQSLLHDCDLHTLLRLPGGIYYYTGIPTNVLFFDTKPAHPEPWTEKLWVYDMRTNKHFSRRRNPLTRADFDDFVTSYHAENRHERRESERFRTFTYDELLKRDHLNLNIFWLQDNTNIQ